MVFQVYTCWYVFVSKKCRPYVGYVQYDKSREIKSGPRWFKFQREVLARVTIQRENMTTGHISMWNYDQRSQFNVEFWSVYISSTYSIATQEGVKIQQSDQNSTAKEGHYSTQTLLSIDPGSVFYGGVKILSYTHSGSVIYYII